MTCRGPALRLYRRPQPDPRRGEQLSDSQILLCERVGRCACPRELLRYSRQLAEVADTGLANMPLTQAMTRLIAEEVTAKIDAAILDARGGLDGVRSELIVSRLGKRPTKSACLSLETLYAKFSSLCCGFNADPTENLQANSSGGTDADDLASKVGPVEAVSSWDDSDSSEARIWAYLTFLRLVERAFADDGPISALADASPCQYDKLPRDALAVFEQLGRTREQLALGRMASQLYLGDAVSAIEMMSLQRTARTCLTTGAATCPHSPESPVD